ncbi:hypothetical protein HZA57_07595 [Candidatus Poribacteria bacterium]|nr:hypothetical protein [Candidatus Poribacteria bacterium]
MESRREPTGEDGAGFAPGWNPQPEAEPRWRGVVQLMREADDPRMPDSDEYEVMWENISSEINVPGGGRVIPVPGPESFPGWLRQVFLGGGAGAQALRLACAGAVAFAVGVQFHQTGARPVESRMQVAEAARPAGATSGGPFPATPAPAAGGVLSRSGIDGEGRLIPAEVASAEFGWRATLPPESSWTYQGAAATRPVSTAAVSGTAERQQVMDLLQQIKFRSLVEQDDDAMGQIRRLEGAIAPLLEAEGQAASGEAAAMESFRRAEDLALRNRYADALLAFHEARTLVPGTFLAFLAQYQIARIDFEHLHDFDSALEAYRVTLEEYPAHFLTDEYKTQIVERIDKLMRNSMNDWEALRLWQEAQGQTGLKRAELLERLVSEVPESPLAADAAAALTDLKLNEPACAELRTEDLLALFDGYLAYRPALAGAAKVQFAKAELLFKGEMDFKQSANEYSRVLTLPGGEAFKAQVNARLAQLDRAE